MTRLDSEETVGVLGDLGGTGAELPECEFTFSRSRFGSLEGPDAPCFLLLLHEESDRVEASMISEDFSS